MNPVIFYACNNFFGIIGGSVIYNNDLIRKISFLRQQRLQRLLYEMLQVIAGDDNTNLYHYQAITSKIDLSSLFRSASGFSLQNSQLYSPAVYRISSCNTCSILFSLI